MEVTDNDICLVTGGTGLLGSHIVEQLRRRHRRVRVLVRPSSDTSWLGTQEVELARGDIIDPGSLKSACGGVKIVYHAAARVGDWGPWKEFVRISIDGTRNLVDAAITAGVERFLHISSISSYGHIDGEGMVLDETCPLGQNLGKWSYYSRAKVAAEQVVWQAHRAGRIGITVIRPSWLYGPRDRATLGRMIDAIRRGKTKLIGNGANRLNLVHAANVAEAAIIAAETEASRGQAYNCSHDGVITQAEFVNAIARAIGEPPVTAKIPYRLVKALAFILEVIGHTLKLKKPPLITRYSAWLMGRRCFFECEKLKTQLGWHPTISYAAGIPEAVEWYLREHQAGRPPVGISAAQA